MRLSFIPFLLALLLAACRDGGPSSPPAPQTTAAFTAGGSAVAGQGVAFDATASVDGAGSGLSYTWTFGDGVRGGTRTVAHPYAQAGAYTVQLVVRDAAGTTATTSQVVNVAAGPSATGTAVVQGRVTLPGGTPLAGVQVAVQGVAGAVATAPDGSVTLPAVPVGVPAVLRLSRAGHLGQVVRLSLPAGAATGYFQTAMVPVGPTAVLAAVENGGTVNGPDGLRIVAPPAAFVDAGGGALTGAVDVSFTPIDLRTQAAAFPGEFAGIQPNGQKTPIASLGVAEVTVTRGGAPVLVSPGKTVTVEIPIYVGSPTMGQSIPLWSLNEPLGTWVQEGTGTVVASPGSPTGMALRGEVAHFTPWNVDVLIANQTGIVRPHCLSAPATPLAVACWVTTAASSTTTPLVGNGVSLAPGVTGTFAALGGSTVKVVAYAAGGLYGESTPVTVATGAIVDVDVVLGGGAPAVNLVAAGGDGLPTLAYFNGTAFTPTSSPFDDPGFGFGRGNVVAWNGTTWVAGGQSSTGNTLAVSPDGVAWTAVTAAPAFNSVHGLAWNGSQWVAVGDGTMGPQFATSPDGLTWTAVGGLPTGPGGGRFVAWNGAYWLAGINFMGMVRSTNGTTWTVQPSPFTSGEPEAGAWNGSLWVVAGLNQNGPAIATSANGSNWTLASAAVPGANAVAWNGSYWLVAGSQAVAKSSDGVTWTTSPVLGTYIQDLTWTGTEWVAVGLPMGGPRALTSPDGVNWTPVLAPFSAFGRSVAYRRPLYPPL